MGTAENGLRAGVIGAGAIVQEAHIPALLENDVEVVAVADANAERARDVGARFGIPYVFDRFESLVELPDLDLVTIGLPNALHAPAAIAALEAGTHVLCEKPMALSAASAEAMIAAAERSGRLLSVNQHMRFSGSAIAIRNAVAAGSLGDVYLLDIRMTRENGIPGYGSWFTNRELAGHGALVDIGVHMLDLALFVLGFPEVMTVKGFLASHLGEHGIGRGSWGIDRQPEGRFDVDDTATATLTLVTGAELRLHVAWAGFARAEERLTVYGTRGGADYLAGRSLELWGAEEGTIVELDAVQTSNDWNGGIDAFVAAVRGEGPLLVRPEEALVTARVLERVAESAALGRELPLSAE